jgi:hypothetical protein
LKPAFQFRIKAHENKNTTRLHKELRYLADKKGIYIYSKSSNKPHMRIYYNKYCKILSRVIKEPKRQHYCRLRAKSDNKIKTTWNIIKFQSGKLHLTEQIPSDLINSEKANDPQIIADAFNTFFLQILENLSLHHEESGDVISFLKKAFPTTKFHV